ncbi:hypothetical protein ACVJGD_007928 [Bradyrhizobium sp. USDA 10063]
MQPRRSATRDQRSSEVAPLVMPRACVARSGKIGFTRSTNPGEADSSRPALVVEPLTPDLLSASFARRTSVKNGRGNFGLRSVRPVSSAVFSPPRTVRAVEERVSEISAARSRAKTWYGFSSSDGQAAEAFALAQAKHLDLDCRTFSRRTVRHSNALERVEGQSSDFSIESSSFCWAPGFAMRFVR